MRRPSSLRSKKRQRDSLGSLRSRGRLRWSSPSCHGATRGHRTGQGCRLRVCKYPPRSVDVAKEVGGGETRSHLHVVQDVAEQLVEGQASLLALCSTAGPRRGCCCLYFDSVPASPSLGLPPSSSSARREAERRVRCERGEECHSFAKAVAAPPCPSWTGPNPPRAQFCLSRLHPQRYCQGRSPPEPVRTTRDGPEPDDAPSLALTRTHGAPSVSEPSAGLDGLASPSVCKRADARWRLRTRPLTVKISLN